MQQQSKTYIREIFTSIQGEGPYIGQKHVFVRFSKCNLACKYCDTDFIIEKSKLFSTDELYNELKSIDVDVISLTGGEPLLEVNFLTEFLKKYKNKLNKEIYLETNGTLYKNLENIIDYVDIIAMDIKLKSATEQENQYEINEEFIKVAIKNNKECFIKVVFDENILNDEINSIINIAKKYNLLIVLQPKMPIKSGFNFEEIYNKIYEKYKNIRLIPQVHKFLNLL